MQDQPFQTGDVVQQKAGGPWMTVRICSLTASGVWHVSCDWFVAGDELRRESFIAEQLIKAK